MIGQDEGSSMAEARILNVNDEANDRDGVTRVLRDAGFEVIEADSGQRALELARPPEQNSVILQNIADAVTAQNGAGEVIYANDAALRLLGYDNLQQFLAAGSAAVAAPFEMLDEEGRPFDRSQLPGQRVLAG